MNTQYLQTIFYHYVLSDPMLTQKIEPDVFEARNLQTCYFYAKDYVTKYHEAPTCEQLKDLIRIAGKNDEIEDGVIDVLYSSSTAMKEYTNEWLFDNVTSWAQWRMFLKSLEDTITYVKLNQDKVSVDNVKEIMEHAKSNFNKTSIVDFTEDNTMGSDFWDAMSHQRRKLIRSSTGYQFIDMCMDGGYFPGCLVCFAGAPKIGKSLWLQNLCAKSVLKGENNCYISLELPEEMIHSRIGANMFGIPSLDYHKYTDDVMAFKEIMTNFRKSCIFPPGQLIVKSFPTSTMSVLDLEAYLLKKEDELSTEGHKFKFKNVFVDYINIMRNYRNPNTENTYMKIKQLAEDLKAIGLKHDWAIITATQTNREQYDSTDMTGSQIAESSGLGATVDLMFGIIADTFMKARGEYYLKVLYDRVSPQDNKRKKFNIDKEFLRISEDESSPIEEVTNEIWASKTGNGQFHGKSRRQQEQSVLPMGPAGSAPSVSSELDSFLQPIPPGQPVSIPPQVSPQVQQAAPLPSGDMNNVKNMFMPKTQGIFENM